MLRQLADQVTPPDDGLRDLGILPRKGRRGLGVSALFAGASGTGKTWRRKCSPATLRARSLSHRSVRGGQQIHRRDREEPAPGVRRRRGRRRRAAVRRGRRAVRQAQRGQGQPRPLRQYRGQLSAAAHGGLSRPGDPHHQPEIVARQGLPAPAALHRPLSVSRRGAARGDLAPRLPGRRRRPRASISTQLAQLNVAGGNIRNIALNAAFLRRGPATRRSAWQHLLDAARLEAQKIERPLAEAEIRGWV